jgi:hypothetical protein
MEFVRHGSLSVTAGVYSHVLLDETEVDYVTSSPLRSARNRAIRATQCRLRADLGGEKMPICRVFHFPLGAFIPV